MPWLPEDWIDEVVGRNDIVELVREYLPLKASGQGYFGLCPFHNEKTPSFHVSPEKQIYHCFGCGEGGNVISFVMAMENLEFIDAMRRLAERVHVPLPEQTTSDVDYQRKRSEKEQLYELNKVCARFYHQALMAKDGKEAMAYLESRDLDTKSIKSFGLGFAPDSWGSTREYLLLKGFKDEQLQEVGITIKNNKGNIYDRFRNRLILPIIDPKGRIIGFGGRVLDDSLPKYLNSPDSPTFNKSTNLFGLNLVRKVRPLEYIIIVEGYMDVITLHQHGFHQAVATLGTSLTKEQASLIRRYASEVYIAYDGDEAGQKATLRAIDILTEADCNVRVMSFPDGLDPDDTLKRYGSEYFKKLIKNSRVSTEFKISNLKRGYDLTIPEDKVGFATAAAEILAKTENLIERDIYIQNIEAATGIKSRVLMDQISKIEYKNGKKDVQKYINGRNRNTNGKKPLKILYPSNEKAEFYLINIIAKNEKYAKKIVDGLGNMTLQDPLHQEVVDIVKGLLERKHDVNEAYILSHITDSDAVNKLVDIFNQEMEYDSIDNFIIDCLNVILNSHLEDKRQELQKEISDMEKESDADTDKYKLLLTELQQINAKLKTPERRELYEQK